MEGFKQVTENNFKDFIKNYSETVEALERWNQTIADRVDYKNNKGVLIGCIQFIDNSFWVKPL